MREPDEGFSEIFRFPLNVRGVEEHDEALSAMVRRHLQELLDIVVLYHEGEQVAVDGFRFLNDPRAVRLIYPDDEKDL
jgi:hypothetical protein